jgi:lipopolysaccharide biosynthesis glycosyltransferase
MIMTEKVRIFIGTSANGEDADAEMTYEYSLRKNTDRELDIVWMRQTRDEKSVWGGWNTERWSTPFSGFRWAIPEVCGFEGRAIYTDVDMINFKDISLLLDTDLNGKPVAARRGSRFGGHEFCVMVFDCQAFEEHSMPVKE